MLAKGVLLVVALGFHAESGFAAAVASDNSWAVNSVGRDSAIQILEKKTSILVAVIDTGVDITHPDLKHAIWTNPGESGADAEGRDKSSNGIDDDGNGFVDDVHGWDFVSNSPNVRDENGHGTHIAGIIGGKGQVKGIAPDVQLMVLKYYSVGLSGAESLANTIRAIRYAVMMNVQIINYSAGGLDFNPLEMQSVRQARDKGVLFVAAAGNEASDSDRQAFYPADYELSNIISVTAYDQNRRLLPSSNYGLNTVDIAAPGEQIFSTLPGGRYGKLTGTSQATAFVTGAAVLLMSRNLYNRAPEEIIAHLINSGDVDESLSGKVRSKARLNAYRALAMKALDEDL